jgi:tRNA uridine 5-carboxymethylaminomethyl modification enzyme
MMQDLRASELLKRPEINYTALQHCQPESLPALAWLHAEQVTIQAKYAGYIDRQQEDIAKLKKQENLKLPIEFDYYNISGLSAELSEKLTKIRPATIAQAARIDGITPAALSLITVYLKKQKACVNA